MPRYDDDDIDVQDAKREDRAYRQWRQHMYDDTPEEYHMSLDVSRKAYDALKDRQEDDDENP